MGNIVALDVVPLQRGQNRPDLRGRAVVVEREPHVPGAVAARRRRPVRGQRHVGWHAAGDRHVQRRRRQRRRAGLDPPPWPSASRDARPGDPAVFQHVDVPAVRAALSISGVQCTDEAPRSPMTDALIATGKVTVTVTGLTVPSLMAGIGRGDAHGRPRRCCRRRFGAHARRQGRGRRDQPRRQGGSALGECWGRQGHAELALRVAVGRATRAGTADGPAARVGPRRRCRARIARKGTTWSGRGSGSLRRCGGILPGCRTACRVRFSRRRGSGAC